ncbi:MAG: hypothetical protein FWE69_03610 [Clostridiales bacterium]|nr:hypothetical protein [Clostridiales bacterium]
MEKIKSRLNMILAFLIMAYLPFIIALSLRYDILNVSLSRIGWQLGGLGFLLAYVLYTVPLMIFQISTFLRISGAKIRLLKAFISIGGILITTGAILPIRETSPQYCHLMHTCLCLLGSVMAIITISYMVALYCKANKCRARRTAILYVGVLAAVGTAFCFLYTAALFEAGASLLFLITMYLLNTTLHRHLNIPQTFPKQNANISPAS